MNGYEQLTSWAQEVRPRLEEARRSATGLRHTIEEFIKSRPVTALSLALGLGVLLGWLVKRR